MLPYEPMTSLIACSDACHFACDHQRANCCCLILWSAATLFSPAWWRVVVPAWNRWTTDIWCYSRCRCSHCQLLSSPVLFQCCAKHCLLCPLPRWSSRLSPVAILMNHYLLIAAWRHSRCRRAIRDTIHHWHWNCWPSSSAGTCRLRDADANDLFSVTILFLRYFNDVVLYNPGYRLTPCHLLPAYDLSSVIAVVITFCCIDVCCYYDTLLRIPHLRYADARYWPCWLTPFVSIVVRDTVWPSTFRCLHFTALEHCGVPHVTI